MDGQLTHLPKIAPIVTGDGSASFFNNQVGETYHSRSGAAREAMEKFCGPSGLGALARDDGLGGDEYGFVGWSLPVHELSEQLGRGLALGEGVGVHAGHRH